MPISKSQQSRLLQLGAKVKSIRNDKNLTLKELAHSIGKDPQSIHRLESGTINPSYLYLIEVCKGLDIDIVELLAGL
jgi:putative transcriptional regulator